MLDCSDFAERASLLHISLYTRRETIFIRAIYPDMMLSLISTESWYQISVSGTDVTSSAISSDTQGFLKAVFPPSLIIT